ncbi:hypothetical protein SAMN02745157_1495 [Kaistia soli DSM 19436]|uniref:DNA gyrase inhibitor YacG n=1 Tax=Kaistia soli DSM 19436 TaxID=1122133 RepID=A0A1M4YDZ2_9HYPH|nr:DNA gyrase inhibitor YacG [Kaistia soli]SHF03980.1 hypothetical protein SAMN02745157_1495 [Kaistia soli DSM 19436]
MTDDKTTPARAADILPLRPRRPCPICGKDSQRDAYPFCSKRCKDIDLNSWLSGRYAIPAVESEDSDPVLDDDGAADDR